MRTGRYTRLYPLITLILRHFILVPWFLSLTHLIKASLPRSSCHNLGEKNCLSRRHGLQEDQGCVWCKIRQEGGFWPKKHESYREIQGRTNLWLVGYSSTVITSRAFQAAILVPQNRHCQPIIADSLLPKNRKKQQTAEMSMEPPMETRQGSEKK